jgi:hypothetical protein
LGGRKKLTLITELFTVLEIVPSCTLVLLRPSYAGAKYTTSFSDNANSRISTQLFGNEAPTGAQRACGETMMVK